MGTPATIDNDGFGTDQAIGFDTALNTAREPLHLSAHDFHRILKLARTIADMEQAAEIGSSHLAEALEYRPRELVA